MSDRPVRPTKPLWWSKKHKDGDYDVIVIGSGMGGMTTAAMLAKAGHRVLVLEQHYVPGGFTHCFTRKGYTWDVGVHAVGEVTQDALPGRLLHAITDGRLKWTSLGETYDIFDYPDGLHLEFPNSPEAFRANLVEAFPAEEAAIDRYIHLCREVTKNMRPFYLGRVMPRGLGSFAEKIGAREARKWLHARCDEVVNELTDDPRLRAVFVAQWGYYGSPPDRASFAMQALVTRHFLYGAFYPEGGSSAIARELLRTVAEAGGWTRIKADVEQILVEGKRAVGVRLKGGEELRAAKVVSAVGISATAERLLPPEARGDEWVTSVSELPPAPAHVCVYLGFKGDAAAAGAGPANRWFYGAWDPAEQTWDVDPDADTVPEVPVLYCSFPSLKDPEHDPGPEQRHTGEIVTFVPWEVFDRWRDTGWRKRGEDYEAFKERMQAQLLKQFFKHLPGLEPLLDYAELSTPLSTDTFVRPRGGSIYGLEPTPERFANPWLRASSPIKNLYFSGAEVTSVGVVGAMMGGVLSAIAADPRGCWPLVNEAMKRKQ